MGQHFKGVSIQNLAHKDFPEAILVCTVREGGTSLGEARTCPVNKSQLFADFSDLITKVPVLAILN